MFAVLHREHDVSLRGPVDVVSLESRTARVTGVVLSNGEVVPAGIDDGIVDADRLRDPAIPLEEL